MSDLESDAKSLLSGIIKDGSPMQFNAQQRAVLAAFAFKCAVIGNHSSPHGAPFFRPGIRYRFRRTRQIPTEVIMWFAAFQGRHRASGMFSSYYTSPSSAHGELSKTLQFYVFSFAAGHLAFQVLAPKWKFLHHAARPFPLIVPAEQWQTATTQFWPSSSSVTWPPQHYLDDESLQLFHTRFSTSINIATQ